ncbi:MAG: ribonuclease HII [Proteobacteria bacterium]|nr:ribonuclease HII [Pseudomonadota bacterium]MBU1583452.1 ribonuclease HII [Pseudomonadota bacterium]MBU2454350.1 ribonuclease HII [Pseudomonadota bacterium]MBU2631604.1 ribonuclease HII [Pseudomonadota bacterium]
MWQFEHKAKTQGYINIAGVDEAGRGPLAGPVVSAAVILPLDFSCKGIDDSKKLSEKKRDALFPLIMEQAIAVSTGISSHLEIDQINILQASLLSMKRAVENLSSLPDFLLIDGKFTIDMDIDQSAVIKGDSRSISIAAASIIAKVTRDAIMEGLHDSYPAYNFIKHKGYPTKAHKEAILKHGPCPVHRLTFKGVKEVVNAG